MKTKKNRKRILIVDDEESIVMFLTRRLRNWGYDVLTATSGREGLQIVERECPDLVLLDILMPEVDGREVCAEIKAKPKFATIPVVFLTALGMPEQIEEGFRVGPADYIVKPFEPEDMKYRIEACL